jgi:dTDP-4-amino-4,6-dideoxygalactose transaminase
MNVPLLDLKAQYRSIKPEIDAAVAEVFESQYFIMGPRVKACEEAIASYSGVSHAIGVASGTDALLIALMAEGIGPGDEVITSPYTFFATAGSVARLGAKPVFVDIDPVTFNIDVTKIAARINDRTRAIMPVHLYGQMADMDPIMELARHHNLVVIEDAAQAIGAEYRGHRAGSIGDYGCFSFFPSKNLGGAGDGGMVVTRDRGRADKVSILRVHGMEPKYYHRFLGGNFRLDALQAAVVEIKLRHLDAWTSARQSNARRYDRLLNEAGVVGAGQLTLPRVVMNRHIFNQYVVRASRRDELKAHLLARQVGVEVYYPVPLHLQECFAGLNYRPGDFPESERAALETLALPIYPELSDAQARYVVESIAEFYHR